MLGDSPSTHGQSFLRSQPELGDLVSWGSGYPQQSTQSWMAGQGETSSLEQGGSVLWCRLTEGPSRAGLPFPTQPEAPGNPPWGQVPPGTLHDCPAQL